MCGIAGELRFDDAPSVADWAAIGAMMARRGPDDDGLWSDARCTLAFRRLAILDLSPAGHQPMATTDGRFVLVFNGELYNFAELRRQLEGAGARFRSTGDSEVVLHALATWGADAFERFNGMFAVALYDTRERTLLLGRDHAGIKPLYHLRTPRGVFFASQYDQLLAHPWSRDLAISEEALGLYLRLAYIPAPYALLRDTHMIEPGTWLAVGADGRTRRGRFFAFPAKRAVGTSLIAVTLLAIPGSIAHYLLGNVDLGLAAALAIGVIPGALLGAKVTAIARERTVRVGFAVLLLAAGLVLGLSELGVF
jgi:asparagine synthase (glutamine-hydrolysing)